MSDVSPSFRFLLFQFFILLSVSPPNILGFFRHLSVSRARAVSDALEGQSFPDSDRLSGNHECGRARGRGPLAKQSRLLLPLGTSDNVSSRGPHKCANSVHQFTTATYDRSKELPRGGERAGPVCLLPMPIVCLVMNVVARPCPFGGPRGAPEK